MKKLIIICLFGVGFAISPKTAEASLTVFDTFGPGDSYDTECSIEVRGRVDVDNILDQYPNARVNLAERAEYS